jgi:PAS domain S-box-containing protein
MSPDQAADLSRAIAGEEIVPHFQPLVDLRTGRLAGFEVLPHWHHTTDGIIHPSAFIPLAEQTGLIGRLTEQLLHFATSAAAAWPGHLTLSINLSPVLLRDRALAQRLRAASDGAGFAFDRLVFPLSEAALIGRPDLTRTSAGELKALGARLALDDFGTGYARLPQLVALRFDWLKVGARFVHSMLARSESRIMVAAVIGLAHNLGMASVAAGVESQTEADMLTALGCDLAQGRRFGQPVPAEAVTAHLSADDPPWRPLRAPAAIVGDMTQRLAAVPSGSIGGLHALSDNAPVGLGLVDANLRYLALNRRLAEMHGAPVADHLGRTVAEMVPHLYRQIAPHLMRAASGQTVDSFELRWQGPGGGADEHVLIVSCEPVRDAADAVAGVAVGVVDITALAGTRDKRGWAATADARSRIPGLTGRQSDVLRLLATGRSVAQIASQLELGASTVRTYLSQAYRALGARNRTEALVQSGLMVRGGA